MIKLDHFKVGIGWHVSFNVRWQWEYNKYLQIVFALDSVNKLFANLEDNKRVPIKIPSFSFIF
jgi:hypothetical protein